MLRRELLLQMYFEELDFINNFKLYNCLIGKSLFLTEFWKL